jgi:hypothetical protein
VLLREGWTWEEVYEAAGTAALKATAERQAAREAERWRTR